MRASGQVDIGLWKIAPTCANGHVLHAKIHGQWACVGGAHLQMDFIVPGIRFWSCCEAWMIEWKTVSPVVHRYMGRTYKFGGRIIGCATLCCACIRWTFWRYNKIYNYWNYTSRILCPEKEGISGAHDKFLCHCWASIQDGEWWNNLNICTWVWMK